MCDPDEYWQNHPELHDIPIYYASSLARKCMAVYQTYINAMNDKIRKAININNPFVFKHISNLKVRERSWGSRPPTHTHTHTCFSLPCVVDCLVLCCWVSEHGPL